jgi:hypothetical protein
VRAVGWPPLFCLLAPASWKRRMAERSVTTAYLADRGTIRFFCFFPEVATAETRVLYVPSSASTSSSQTTMHACHAPGDRGDDGARVALSRKSPWTVASGIYRSAGRSGSAGQPSSLRRSSPAKGRPRGSSRTWPRSATLSMLSTAGLSDGNSSIGRRRAIRRRR